MTHHKTIFFIDFYTIMDSLLLILNALDLKKWV